MLVVTEFAYDWRVGLIGHRPENIAVPSAVRVPKRDDLKIHRKRLSPATKGQFEGESVRGDEPLCNRDIGPENIVRSETVRDFDVASRRRW